MRIVSVGMWLGFVSFCVVLPLEKGLLDRLLLDFLGGFFHGLDGRT